MTGLMGDFYKRQLTAQEWLVSCGVKKEQAGAYIGALFKTIAADSANAGADTFHDLVAEQTPGGLNEMVWKDMEQDGAYEALRYSMDSSHHRWATGKPNPELAPARKRARKV